MAKVTGEALVEKSIRKVGLLGTIFTMEQDFTVMKLKQKESRSSVPNEQDRQLVSQMIYRELCLGVLSDYSRKNYLRIISELADQGAEGVILGCTEIGLLVKQSDTIVPLFDTTEIHAQSAALKSLEESGEL